jgi:hypothetical protein
VKQEITTTSTTATTLNTTTPTAVGKGLAAAAVVGREGKVARSRNTLLRISRPLMLRIGLLVLLMGGRDHLGEGLVVSRVVLLIHRILGGQQTNNNGNNNNNNNNNNKKNK